VKKCPFCAEEIQDEAVKCRWCNEFLSKSVVSSSKNEGTRKYISLPVIIFAMVSIGPFAPFLLPLVWKNTNLSKNIKIIVTICTVVFALVIIKALFWAFNSVGQYYKIVFSSLG
jgi:hypothetical protein